MGLDWILVDSSEDVLETFRGKGISTLARLPTDLKDACYGEDGELSQVDRDKLLDFLQTLLKSTNPADFLYEDEDEDEDNDVSQTKSFIEDACTFLASCDYAMNHITCWY